MNYLFISDTHFADRSNIRTGDILKDLLEKFRYVIDFANDADALILHGGDFFDKPLIPNSVITAIIAELKRCKYVPIVIPGNHDKLYENQTYFERTALRLLYETGFVRDCSNQMEGDVFVSSTLPIVDRGHNQIVIYHGHLNSPPDGIYVVHNEDFKATKDKVALCLGHFHDETPVVKYDNYDIFRIGSFIRGIREEKQFRVPKCLLIKPDLSYEAYEIPARPFEYIFKEKRSKLKQSGITESYSRLLELFQSTNQRSHLTLPEALAQVTDPLTIKYIESLPPVS
jgi:DNA repair exonuclease SbcCD nuclease subunit